MYDTYLLTYLDMGKGDVTLNNSGTYLIADVYAGSLVRFPFSIAIYGILQQSEHFSHSALLICF